MIGIYKITNRVNGHCYIGQSRQIEKRWKNHLIAAYNENDKGYSYPLYRAIRKYGIENFEFQVLEECSIDELNSKEAYWIRECHSDYNQTAGGDFQIVPQKLTEKQVKEIQRILIADKKGYVIHKDLADQYHVHKDTIRDINVGRTWFDESLNYPLHFSRFDGSKPQEMKEHHCEKCGALISKGAKLCKPCADKEKITEKPVSREELKDLIRTTPFTRIGAKYGVSDNTIRKWCDRYNLPRKSSEIKKISDEEWVLI